jgi:hypothetical protein
MPSSIGHVIDALRAKACGIEPALQSLAFGAFVGAARLVGSVQHRDGFATGCQRAPGVELPADWWRIAEDAWNPLITKPVGHLWVFDRPVHLAAPMTWRGQLGLWDAPSLVVARLNAAADRPPRRIG